MNKKLISKVTWTLLPLITTMSFVLSYNALQQIAVQNGLPIVLSYIWPFIIDVPVITFSIAAINARIHKQSTSVQWLSVGVYTVLTITFNILHAPNNWLAWLVAAIPPFSLFLSLEMLMLMVKYDVSLSDTIIGLAQLEKKLSGIKESVSDKSGELTTIESDLSQKESKLAQLNSRIEQAELKLSKTNKVDKRQEIIVELKRQKMTHAAIADELGCHVSTVDRAVRLMKDRNGNKPQEPT